MQRSVRGAGAMNIGLLRAVNAGADVYRLPLRVVEYARVSTASAAQRHSLDNQHETYRRLIAQTPAWTYAGAYTDAAVSGTKASARSGFLQMIADAEAGRFDMIVVKDVARFARNIKECLVYKDRLKACGVMVWFFKENLNTFRASDELMLQFMALGAQLEAESARARTKIVFEQGIQNGRIYGNSSLLGYRKRGGRLYVEPAEAETVRRIFHLYVENGYGLRRIAAALAAEGLGRADGRLVPPRTVKAVLENPKYKGFFCGGKTETIDVGERYIRRPRPPETWASWRDPAVPAIVSEALWDAAAAQRAARAAQYHAAGHPVSRAVCGAEQPG